jgi:hypothetical protein
MKQTTIQLTNQILLFSCISLKLSFIENIGSSEKSGEGVGERKREISNGPNGERKGERGKETRNSQ